MKPARFLLYLFVTPLAAVLIAIYLGIGPWDREPAPNPLHASVLSDIPMLLDILHDHFFDDACYYGDDESKRCAQEIHGTVSQSF